MTSRGFKVFLAAYDEVAFDPDAQRTVETRMAAMASTAAMLAALAAYHAENFTAVYGNLPAHLRDPLGRQVEESLRVAAQAWDKFAHAYRVYADEMAAQLNRTYGADLTGAAAAQRH